MGKSLDRVHRDIQRERIKREVIKHMEKKCIPEIAVGVKGIVLLALKKEGWGQQRAIRLWDAVEEIQMDILEERITWDDVFDQVREEYKLELRGEGE